nr:MAG TPA: hypothetical protein [Caudoviricetes sp.]
MRSEPSMCISAMHTEKRERRRSNRSNATRVRERRNPRRG